jgi:hypothetical protein
VGVFGKNVRSHSQRAAAPQNGAVVPSVEEKAGMPDGEIAAHDGKDIVFTGRTHGYSMVR